MIIRNIFLLILHKTSHLDRLDEKVQMRDHNMVSMRNKKNKYPSNVIKYSSYMYLELW